MTAEKLMLIEYEQLSLQIERHAGFPYQAVPIVVTIAGALLAFGQKDELFVGPFVVAGLLFLLLSWAFAHANMLYFGVRLIQLEEEIEKVKQRELEGTQRDSHGYKLQNWSNTMCEPRKGFALYCKITILLAAIFFGVALYYMWHDVHNMLCWANQYWEYFSVLAACSAVIVALWLVTIIVSKVIALETRKVKRCQEVMEQAKSGALGKVLLCGP